MASVSDLIRTILNEKFGKGVDELEKRFTREATDISQLEIQIDVLKSKRIIFNNLIFNI